MAAFDICKKHDHVVPCWDCSTDRIVDLEQKISDLRMAIPKTGRLEELARWFDSHQGPWSFVASDIRVWIEKIHTVERSRE